MVSVKPLQLRCPQCDDTIVIPVEVSQLLDFRVGGPSYRVTGDTDTLRDHIREHLNSKAEKTVARVAHLDMPDAEFDSRLESYNELARIRSSTLIALGIVPDVGSNRSAMHGALMRAFELGVQVNVMRPGADE